MGVVNKTLGDLARVNPAATRVFWRCRLDFCCGGQLTLVEARKAAGLDAGAIAREIAEEKARDDDPPGWDERSQAEVADYIVSRYHAGLRKVGIRGQKQHRWMSLQPATEAPLAPPPSSTFQWASNSPRLLRPGIWRLAWPVRAWHAA